jgi:NAD-dependent dihydropyrimidine dehydrogenase PreA subunit
MTYVITDRCVGTKEASCIEVCPVDCIHPMPGEPGYDEAEQLYIDPRECIDCNACVDVCPVDAPLSADAERDWDPGAVERNAAFFASA